MDLLRLDSAPPELILPLVVSIERAEADEDDGSSRDVRRCRLLGSLRLPLDARGFPDAGKLGRLRDALLAFGYGAESLRDAQRYSDSDFEALSPDVEAEARRLLDKTRRILGPDFSLRFDDVDGEIQEMAIAPLVEIACLDWTPDDLASWIPASDEFFDIVAARVEALLGPLLVPHWHSQPPVHESASRSWTDWASSAARGFEALEIEQALPAARPTLAKARAL